MIRINDMNILHAVSIKMVLFSVIDGKLMVYLPDGVLPSVNLSSASSFEDAVTSILSTLSLSINDGYIEQLNTAIVPESDIRVSVNYYMLLEEGKRSKFLFAGWRDAHSQFLDSSTMTYAVKRLQWKIEYTNIIYSLLPLEFTLTQLQVVYEAILGRQLDKRNFRKKILSLGMLIDTKKKTIQGRARPAEIYSFKSREMTFVEVL